MADKYGSFPELARNEKGGRDFRIHCRDRGSATVIVAPHGGGIEPGTSEIADAIAGDDLSFCAFVGMKSRGNRDLHITSTRFDEPRCVAIVSASEKAVSIHGAERLGSVVFLGGRDRDSVNHLRAALEERGFCARIDPRLLGQGKKNICNRGRSGVGLQLELSKALRCSFFESLTKSGRRKKTRRFWEFISVVRRVIRHNVHSDATEQL
jgi:phage replication-related protein YjqB (UPF0714/DUF867 family)